MGRKINFEKYKNFETFTKEGYRIRVIDFYKFDDVISEFDNGYRVRGSMKEVIDGGICNPFHPTAFGVGYMGEGSYTSKHISYTYWYSLIRRCYSVTELEKHPSYRSTVVCKEWHNFQNFGYWFEQNYIEGWQLDKDILIRGSLIYSAENCCFVPQEINKLFTKRQNDRGDYPIGVSKKGDKFLSQVSINGKRIHIGSFNTPEEAFQAYKQVKEAYIKEVADKWKDQIEPRVYQAMYNYKVEITD